MPSDERKRIQERERTTIDEAREEGSGATPPGPETAVPDYTDPGGVSDLGVDEPVVPPAERGEEPPAREGPSEGR